MNEYDVAVVGFGPVGATLAALCARRGLSVVAIDKDLDVYPLPRAAHVDHEVMRIWQEIGCADELLATMRENVGMDFLTADHEVLHRMRSPGMASSGWPASLFFHQPAVERTVRKTAQDLGVHVQLGTEVTGLETRTNGARLTLAEGSPLEASWVIGCDGARSFVRKELAIDSDDLQFEEPWIVVDVVIRGDAPRLPDRALQVCDPARPHTVVPMPKPRCRFEFMLLPGEDAAAMQSPDVVRGLMTPWVDPDAVEIERSAVYTFHGLIARTWRQGRVLLAGDAAHQMPPFLGQGMCSGLRDAANLAWKLDAVQRGRAPDALLDTYQLEREPHVRTIVELAVAFGRIICTTDPAVAAERDRVMGAAQRERASGAEAPNALPGLQPGPLVQGDGRLAPQPICNGVRLDDLVGRRFAVIARDRPLLTGEESAFWARRACFVDAVTHPALGEMLDELRADVVVIRPDRYVLAAGATLAPITERVRTMFEMENVA
jgi:2-polyprenyl-6-methoxyphenol hydroxylase-like FAD-dependent oxidoreductase